MYRRFLVYLFCIAGCGLLTLNVTGFFLSLRNPDIHEEPISHLFGSTLTEKDFYQAIAAVEGASLEDSLRKFNEVVNRGMAHYWWDEGIDQYNLRIPPHENYLLFFASYLYPEKYRKYEICNIHKAIERGVGICTQQAGVLSTLLEERHRENKLWLLRRHTVVIAHAGNEWWLLDPDYGVVVPEDYRTVMANPRSITPYYAAKGYEPHTIENLIDIYGVDGPVGAIATWEQYLGKSCVYEQYAYIAKWLLPVLLLTVPVLWKLHIRHAIPL